MNRLMPGPYGEAIGAALAVVPEPIMARLMHVHFLTGTDPFWAGLERGPEDCLDGRSYHNTGHCAYPWYTEDQTTTIVMPTPLEPCLVVHELGHALDETLAFQHLAAPVTQYALTNRQEAFAEAFTAWLYWYGDQDAFLQDLPTLALFDQLVGGVTSED